MFARSISFLFSLIARWRRDPVVPLVLVLIAGGLWGFVEIAEEVQDKDSRPIDEAIMLAMREPGDVSDPLGPHWVEEMGRDLTALGGFTVLTIITLTVTGFLLFLGSKRLAGITLVAVVGGVLFTHFLKVGFERERPDLVTHAVVVTNASFPSGHTKMATVVYMTLGVLLARTLPGWRLRVFVISVSGVIAILVGVSRVYLGVHWPTDVLAGWTLGGSWALICWLLAIRFDPRDPAAIGEVLHAGEDG